MSEWCDLFAPPAAGAKSVTCCFRVLRRHGHDLLALPVSPPAAARALTLYPAQTRLARASKRLLGAALSMGVPMPLPRVDLPVAENDPLLAWLCEILGPANIPALAILAGNPFSAGRRFILLAFRGDEPAIVAKAGLTAEGRALIEREAAFLETVADRRPHLPRFRGRQVAEKFSSLALDFIEGNSPAADDSAGLRAVLESWLDPAHPVPLDALTPWQRLPPHAILERMGHRQVVPALFHGDFAPWNVRVETSSQHWTVIDWERGVAAGVPAWDWFHWAIHVSILVHHHDAATCAEFLGTTLHCPDFQEYAHAAQITGIEPALLAAYLIYLHEFIVPPSGSHPGRPDIKRTVATLRDIFLSRL